MKRAFERFQMWVWAMPLPDWVRSVLLWLGSQKFLASVAIVVLNERGEILLFKHTYRRDIPWGIPGGWLKGGEQPECAIQREIMEETGLVARVTRILWVGNSHDIPCVDIIYQGTLEPGIFRPSDEVSEIAFFPLDALPRVTWETTRLVELIRAQAVMPQAGQAQPEEHVK